MRALLWTMCVSESMMQRQPRSSFDTRRSTSQPPEAPFRGMRRALTAWPPVSRSAMALASPAVFTGPPECLRDFGVPADRTRAGISARVAPRIMERMGTPGFGWILALCGAGLQSGPVQRGAPVQAGAERGEGHEHAGLDPPVLQAFMEEDGQRGGGGVAVAFDVVGDLLRRQPQGLLHALDD